MAKIKVHKKTTEADEILEVADFFKKNQNLIIALLIIVAAIIVGRNWYKSSLEEAQMASFDRLYEVEQLYNDKNYDEVIARGSEFEEKFDGMTAGGQIALLVARSYIETDKKDEALEYLKSNNASYNGIEIVKYSFDHILAGLYFDKWYKTKDAKDAEKAIAHYKKAAKAAGGAYEYENIYLAAAVYSELGEKAKAKELLKPVYDTRDEAGNSIITEDIRRLYEELD